jgi:hypothetical protein
MKETLRLRNILVEPKAKELKWPTILILYSQMLDKFMPPSNLIINFSHAMLLFTSSLCP